MVFLSPDSRAQSLLYYKSVVFIRVDIVLCDRVIWQHLRVPLLGVRELFC